MIKKLNFLDQNKVKEFAKNTGLNELQSAILLNRGYKEEDATMIDENLKDLISPVNMANATEAAIKIVSHIKNKEKIVLYSDYDADGWGAAIIGYKMITKLGGNIDIYINNRNDGYGICNKGIDNILKLWPDTKLILTADNGIVAFDAIEYVKSKNIDIIVTDHHQPIPTGKLPDCICINPHVATDTYPFKELCGAGVLWKVLSICYFLCGLDPDKDSLEFLDILAVSTIADVVPLIGENRIIVKEGLKLINNDSRVQWISLKKKLCPNMFSPLVTSKTIGWNFGPAINAVSRMSGSIMDAINLFLTDDINEIELTAENMVKNNALRKALTNDQFNASLVLANEIADDPAIIVYNEEFSEGLIGLIAGKLKEAYWKPSICFTKTEDGDWKGSGRSIDGINIKEVLDQIQLKEPILKAYGGHALACGLTVGENELDKFIFMFNEICDSYDESIFINNVKIDAVYKEGEMSEKVWDSIAYLEPFGASFEEPIIMVSDVDIINAELFKDNLHLKITCNGFTIICWNEGHRFDVDEIMTHKTLSAFGTLDNQMQLIIGYSDIKFN